MRSAAGLPDVTWPAGTPVDCAQADHGRSPPAGRTGAALLLCTEYRTSLLLAALYAHRIASRGLFAVPSRPAPHVPTQPTASLGLGENRNRSRLVKPSEATGTGAGRTNRRIPFHFHGTIKRTGARAQGNESDRGRQGGEEGRRQATREGRELAYLRGWVRDARPPSPTDPMMA